MSDSPATRRPRGNSPRGQFDQSKKVAEALIDQKRLLEREKSKRLKALRLAREQQTSGQNIQG